MKRAWKSVADLGMKMTGLLLITVFLGVCLLLLVRMIPQDAIRSHVQDSSYVNIQEGPSPCLIQGQVCSQLDNFTDAWMMLISYYRGQDRLQDVMLAPYPHYTDVGADPPQNLHIYSLNLGSLPEINCQPDIRDYGRYWHGYQLWLIPMLVLFRVNQIRFINAVLQIGCVAAVLWLLRKNRKSKLMLPFILMWLVLFPPALAASFQYYSSFYVTMVITFMLLLLGYSRKKEWVASELKTLCLIFELSGILMAYFDFLTYPTLALGVPLVIYFALDAEAGKTIRLRIWELFCCCVSWFFGYIGMWGSKWVLATLLTPVNVIANAMRAASERSAPSMNEVTFGYGEILQRIWRYINSPLILIPTLLIIGLGCVLLLLRGVDRRYYVSAMVILLVGAFPFVWYGTIQNHSWIHLFCPIGRWRQAFLP